MKLFLTIFLVVAGFVVIEAETDPKAQRKQFLEECGKEEDINQNLDFLDGDDLPDFAKLADPKYRCVPKCIFMKFGVVDESGNYKMDKLKELAPEMPGLVEATIKDCVHANTDADICDRYMKTLVCITEKFMPKP